MYKSWMHRIMVRASGLTRPIQKIHQDPAKTLQEFNREPLKRSSNPKSSMSETWIRKTFISETIDAIRSQDNTTWYILTYRDRVTPYDDVGSRLPQAKRQQATTLTDVDFSLMSFCGIHTRANLLRVPKLLKCVIDLKIMPLIFS